MTDDFIVNLKGYILMEHRFPCDAWCDPDDVQAALNEIERLRAALGELANKAAIAAAMCSNEGAAKSFQYLGDTARTALERKKTDD
jgi:hypothetical protein